LESWFIVEGCGPLEEIDARQCDTDILERQEIYDEDWVRSLFY